MQKEPNILTEGESYLFLIHNKVILPAEDQEAFILIGPNNKKHLMNASYYTLYHFSIGQTIKCTVDKINCSGQIFLEPEHPYYQSGEVYNFLVLAWPPALMHGAMLCIQHG